MTAKLITVLLTVVLVAIFAVQNSAQTTIQFLIFEWSVSEALVIIVAAVAGCLIGLLIYTMRSIRQGKEVRNIQKNMTSADATIKEQQMKIEQLQHVIQELMEERDGLAKTVEALRDKTDNDQ